MGRGGIDLRYFGYSFHCCDTWDIGTNQIMTIICTIHRIEVLGSLDDPKESWLCPRCYDDSKLLERVLDNVGNKNKYLKARLDGLVDALTIHQHKCWKVAWAEEI